jgi:hypothetical protein
VVRVAAPWALPSVPSPLCHAQPGYGLASPRAQVLLEGRRVRIGTAPTAREKRRLG